MSKNQLPGTAKTRIASSVSVSPINRNGMQARIKKFDTKKMALAGALAYHIKRNKFLQNYGRVNVTQIYSPIVLGMPKILDF